MGSLALLRNINGFSIFYLNLNIITFPVFITPIVWNTCENLHYQSIYFKELPKNTINGQHTEWRQLLCQLLLQPLPQKSYGYHIKLTDWWITSLLFDL